MSTRALDVEAEVDHVAVAHDVILALEAELARFLRTLLATVRHEVIVRRNFGADETALKIAVDHAGGLWRRGAGGNRPSAHFLRPGGEIGLQAKKLVGSAGDAVQARLGPAPVLAEEPLMFLPP